jgi:hypothetical protein
MTATDPKRSYVSVINLSPLLFIGTIMRNVFSSQLIATLANIGVIIGLIFLVLEIRQSNRIATATSEIEIRTMFSELNEALYAVPEFDQLLVKAQDRNAELTAEEEIRATGFVLRLTNAWMAIEIAHENDMLPPDTYSAIEDDVRAAMTRFPAFAPLFRQNLNEYPGQGSRQVHVIIEKVLNEHHN